MQLKPSQRWFGVISIALALMPLSFSVPFRAKVIPIAVLFFSGLVLLARRADVRASMREAMPVIAVCLLSLVYALLSVLGHGLSWLEMDLPSHILMFVLVAAAFAAPPSLRTMWIGFSLSAAFLGLVCMYQHYLQGIDRAEGLNSGGWGAIEFGMFMLVLVLPALHCLLSKGIPRADKVVHAAGLALGMYGAVLTQSRGPLLAFIPVFLLVVLLHVWRTRDWRRGLILSICALALVGISTSSVYHQIEARFAVVHQEIARYSPKDADGSIGERLEMWRTAWNAFESHPWTGIGIDQFGVYVQEQVEHGQSNPAIAKYVHPHSEYLEAAATGGVPGFIVLLLLYGVPIVYFARRIRHAEEGLAMSASIGLTVVAMYATCSITDNVLYRAMPHSLFFFLVLGMAVSVGHRLQAMRD